MGGRFCGLLQALLRERVYTNMVAATYICIYIYIYVDIYIYTHMGFTVKIHSIIDISKHV